MDPILSEVYSTVLPAAPYVLAAYIGIWLVLFIFVLALWRKSKRTSEDKGGVLASFSLTEEQGNEIIMAARAHWFEDEDDAAASNEEAAHAEPSE